MYVLNQKVDLFALTLIINTILLFLLGFSILGFLSTTLVLYFYFEMFRFFSVPLQEPLFIRLLNVFGFLEKVAFSHSPPLKINLVVSRNELRMLLIDRVLLFQGRTTGEYPPLPLFLQRIPFRFISLHEFFELLFHAKKGFTRGGFLLLFQRTSVDGTYVIRICPVFAHLTLFGLLYWFLKRIIASFEAAF